MNTISKNQIKWIEEHTYKSPTGIKFIFWQDIKKFFKRKQNLKKFEEFMSGSTQLLLPNGEPGLYPIDLIYFLRGYKVNPD